MDQSQEPSQRQPDRDRDRRDAPRPIRRLVGKPHLRAEVRRERRLSVLTEVAGGIAHGFNNVLAMALGECHLLESRPLLDPDVQRSLERMRTCLLHTAASTRRLRSLLQAAPIAADQEGVDLNQHVRELVSFTRPLWREESVRRGIQVRVRTRLKASGRVGGRREWLREVVTSLLLHAIDAVEQDTTVTLTTGDDEFGPWLTVHHCGSVLDPVTRARLQEPFWVPGDPRRYALSLSSCTNLVERLGGKLVVHSDHVRGTTLHVRLPPASTHAA